mmetsp:Transcript_10383/g.14954  ORF Transcript_10383/g.14954 Transcript_10383/m.14954 type:complete len:1057 (-) Transcript_10383:6976-10146(-)
MSRAHQSTAKKKSPPEITSGEFDRGPRQNTSSSASLPTTTYRYTRRAGPPTVGTSYKAAVMSTNANVDDVKPEPWMETVTPGKFTNFQTKVFTIVNEITNKPENSQHHFTIKWKRLCQITKNPMSATISWRSLKGLLGLRDIFDYKAYIQQCPNIAEYIKFAPSTATKTGFDFGVYERTTDDETQLDSSTLPSSSPSNDSPSTTGTESYVIDFTDHHFLALANQKLPAKTTEPTQEAKDDYSSETRIIDDVSPAQNDQLILTPKQTNVNALPKTVSLAVSGQHGKHTSDQPNVPNEDASQHDEIPEDVDIAWSVTDDSPGFRQVHYRLFETVTTWFQQDSAKQHPFHTKWRKALFVGLQATTTWDRVAKILKLEYVKDYIAFMNECPRIQERYELHWSYFDNTIRYTELDLPELNDVNNDIANLNVFQRQIQGMIIRFDTMFKDVENRVDAVNLRTSACEENILNRVSTRLANNVTQQMSNISRYATNAMQSFTINIQENVDRQLLLYSENIAVMHQSSYDRMEARIAVLEQKLKEQAELLETTFYQRFDEAMEVGIQDINDNVDDAVDKFNQHVDEATERFNKCAQPVQQETAAAVGTNTTSSRWNVDPAYRQQLENLIPTQPLSTDQQPTMTSQQTQVQSNPEHTTDPSIQNRVDTQTEWGMDGPPFQPAKRLPQQQGWHQGYQNYHQQSNPDGLPMVQSTEFLKRVKLPYPGRDQSYTWYLQLKSNAQQYGVYLCDLEEFKKDKSLCPTELYGIPVIASRYHDMKTALYHFLAQPTIISNDHHDVRNIVNKFALSTEGYRALYDIMKRIHPVLDPDAVFDVPEIKNYADVHEYYLYVDAYYMHEKFSGRIYTPRAKLNTFLNGLDSQYQIAISRIRGIMDAWPTTETKVPEILQLENLPTQVEKYLEENGGKAIVRRVQFKRGNSQREETARVDAALSRKYVDIQCPLCQSYGHPKTQCDRMALWMNLKDASKIVDEKLRAILSKNYAKIDAERRAKKVSRIKGTVRQLFSDGQFSAGEQLLDDCLTKYCVDAHDTLTPDAYHESESEQSDVE